MKSSLQMAMRSLVVFFMLMAQPFALRKYLGRDFEWWMYIAALPIAIVAELLFCQYFKSPYGRTWWTSDYTPTRDEFREFFSWSGWQGKVWNAKAVLQDLTRGGVWLLLASVFMTAVSSGLYESIKILVSAEAAERVSLFVVCASVLTSTSFFRKYRLIEESS